MVFSNAVFLFIFLPIVLIVYYLLRGRARNYWLLISSIIFYAWNKPSFTLILLFSIMVNYLGAIAIEKYRNGKYEKLILCSVVSVNVLILFYFKYFNFAVDVINKFFKSELIFTLVILPIGISFFTFQGISYVVDVYRQEVCAQKNIVKLAMYISLFPQLVAGPIVRYTDVVKEIDDRTVTVQDFADGIERFIIGLFKKIIIADTMAVIANAMFDKDLFLNSVPMAWLGVITYTMQIFFDFAGYSDMAIGLGRMFGFHLKENFNYPYISKSITEFWRRWHISLSSFFRDYVYIPIGGNRKHVYFNVAIVFLLTGIWHGAAFTYILWGIWHGFFNLLEKFINSKRKITDETGVKKNAVKFIVIIMKHIYTLSVVSIGWVIFRVPGITNVINYIKSLFGMYNLKQTAYTIGFFMDKWTVLIMILALVMSTPVLKNMGLFIEKKIREAIYIPMKYLTLLGILLLCIMQVASNTYSAFIYFQF